MFEFVTPDTHRAPNEAQKQLVEQLYLQAMIDSDFMEAIGITACALIARSAVDRGVTDPDEATAALRRNVGFNIALLSTGVER